MKRLLKNLAYQLNNVVPIFPKDYVWGYDLLDNEFIFPSGLNKRFFEMQYYNDFNEEYIVSLFSKYLKNKQSGIIFYNRIDHSIDRIQYFDEGYNTTGLRIVDDEILVVLKNDDVYYLYNLKDMDTCIRKMSTAEFDVVNDGVNTYILCDNKIYSSSDICGEWHFICALDIKSNYKYVNNYSMTRHKGLYYLACRVGNHQALNTKIALYSSLDLKNWELHGEIIDSNKLKHMGVDGVGFPTIRACNDKLEIFFTSYWGKHLLRKRTIKYWSGIK